MTQRIRLIGTHRPQPESKRQALLEAQGGRCYYCANLFGSAVWRPGKPDVILRDNWEHFQPWAFTWSSPLEGFVLACQVCNGFKGSQVFASPLEAVVFIQECWERRRFRVPTEAQLAKLPQFAR